MYKLLCISNRRLCCDDFIKRMQCIIDSGVPLILREKDLTEQQYYDMLCKINRKNIIAHTFVAPAREFGCSSIHLPLPLLQTADVSDFSLVGASTHSVRQAKLAKELGADYITAGHIYATKCKKGLMPHGTSLLSEISAAVDIELYALGGISPENAAECIKAGATGVCVMSACMQQSSFTEYMDKYKHIL